MLFSLCWLFASPSEVDKFMERATAGGESEDEDVRNFHTETYTLLSSPFFADLISKMPQNNRCFGKFVGVQRFSQFLSTFLSGESDHFTVHFPLNPWSLLVGGYSGLSNAWKRST